MSVDKDKEKALVLRVARAAWVEQRLQEDVNAKPKDVFAIWSEVDKKPAMAFARKLISRFEKDGVSVKLEDVGS